MFIMCVSYMCLSHRSHKICWQLCYVCKILNKYFRKGQVNNVQLLQLTSFVAYFTFKKAAIQQQVLVWQQGNGQVKSNLLA